MHRIVNRLPACTRGLLCPALHPALYLALLLYLPPLTGSTAPDESNRQEIEAHLKAIETDLQKYRKLLTRTTDKRSRIENTLQDNEKKISKLINKINDIKTQLQQSEAQISQLNREQQKLHKAKTGQQHHIAQHIRTAYELGNTEFLKMLLNQEDPNETARMLTYYGYFNRARAAQINRYNATIAELDRVALALTREHQLLGENRQSLSSKWSALADTRATKQSTLKALNDEITATGTTLTRLEEDQEKFEQLMVQFQRHLANLSYPSSLRDAAPFATMRGKLHLPVAGRISHRFGNKRSHGRLKWQGMVIEASEGEPVYAVHPGRVVFSDWLRGFGLLLIINHGDGYMSLYGHNQALYREIGDLVIAGDVIATVGNSGGQGNAGLYFEIRIAGKPSDPLIWCIVRDRGTA